MPRRADLHSILIIGAGPIIIGQACEFDYSGAQACKALREEGFRVVLVNSNPATIMTDPGMADATYIEPITWEVLARIIAQEKAGAGLDAILPTMGGQTALNCALDLWRHGVLQQHDVQLIGAKPEAISKAEDRQKFKAVMEKIGLESARSGIARTLEEALAVQALIGFPTIIRPSFTMGGSGGGIAYNIEEFIAICTRGLELSPTRELLIEESLLGWKEFEMEVVRDHRDNCIIVCSIENLDPMGVHTGDSITVAPAQTLTDREYQIMRNASLAVLREIGVDTGGSNVQFAINPADGRLIVIEMNPRVSRSSALASKATGFPIAKVAAKLAVGYTLDELRNEITGGQTPASFEPSIDYVVTKIPRFAFEKFPQADDRLTTQMKSVGEVMAIGRTFQESFQKALRGLETGLSGLNPRGVEPERLAQELGEPGPDRILHVADAFRLGKSLEDVHAQSRIDPWFLAQIADLVAEERALERAAQALLRRREAAAGDERRSDGAEATPASEGRLATLPAARTQAQQLEVLDAATLRGLKRKGFSDRRIAQLLQVDTSAVRAQRWTLGIHPVYKRVDTCAAEFATSTAYLYSTYETECEARPSDRRKIMVLGGGPNRIGQGIEFDYCCVQAALALRADGFETLMVNCNPETVSTDYDTADRLYFEPLTLEDVLEIVRIERPLGVIVQYGGQTPLNLAQALEANQVPIIGTHPDRIDQAEDRERFQQLLHQFGLRQPENAIARNEKDALVLAACIGYPLVVRPSFVLGGRAMRIVQREDDLARYMREAIKVSNESPVLLDRYLNDAIEVDIDAVSDGTQVLIAGMMEHIEQAGIHSGDSACSLPPHSLSQAVQQALREQTVALALALQVVGLMNVQFALQRGEEGEDVLYVLEVNPRASRTIPFVSKATGVAWAQVAARCMAGQSLAAQGITQAVIPPYFSVKEAVFPFAKFPGVDSILGPEMKSTGEVMGIAPSFAEAYLKAQIGAGERIALPTRAAKDIPRDGLRGRAFLSVRDVDKAVVPEIARQFTLAGWEVVATRGTAATIAAEGITVRMVNKVQEGRPHIVDMVKNGEIQLIVNTVEDQEAAIEASRSIRQEALKARLPLYTTVAAGRAIARSLAHREAWSLEDLQSLHRRLNLA